MPWDPTAASSVLDEGTYGRYRLIRTEKGEEGEEGKWAGVNKPKYTISIWWRLLSNLCKTRCERFVESEGHNCKFVAEKTKTKKHIKSSSKVIKFQAVEFVLDNKFRHSFRGHQYKYAQSVNINTQCLNNFYDYWLLIATQSLKSLLRRY